MARHRKPGPRAKSGRLNRAHTRNPELRDKGTYESQAKRHALINGADPQLAATASGILFANGYLSQGQHHAALRYARLHAIVFGKPWPHSCPLARELAHHGGEPPEGLLAFAESRLVELNALLSPAERSAVANLAVYGFHPPWFTAAKLQLRPMPEDERDRVALLSGLDVLASAVPERE